MTVYLDLLLCYNLAVHFCLLSSTAALGGIKMKKGRMLCGCMLGSLFSFAIFFAFSAPVFLLLKALMAASLMLVSFGYGGLKVFLCRICIFLAVNTVYAGAMLTVAFTLSPKGMVYQSGVAYFGGNTLRYVLGLCLGYLLMRGISLLRQSKKGRIYHSVTVVCDAQKITLNALYDSGNLLTDLYSGLPVMILSPDAAEKLMSKEVCSDMMEGHFSKAVQAFGHKARLLPLSTVGGSALTVCFVPDEIIIDGKAGYRFCAMVAREKLSADAPALLPACM